MWGGIQSRCNGMLYSSLVSLSLLYKALSHAHVYTHRTDRESAHKFLFFLTERDGELYTVLLRGRRDTQVLGGRQPHSLSLSLYPPPPLESSDSNIFDTQRQKRTRWKTTKKSFVCSPAAYILVFLSWEKYARVDMAIYLFGKKSLKMSRTKVIVT